MTSNTWAVFLAAILALLLAVLLWRYLSERERHLQTRAELRHARGELHVHEVRAEVERGRGA